MFGSSGVSDGSKRKSDDLYIRLLLSTSLIPLTIRSRRSLTRSPLSFSFSSQVFAATSSAVVKTGSATFFGSTSDWKSHSVNLTLVSPSRRGITLIESNRQKTTADVSTIKTVCCRDHPLWIDHPPTTEVMVFITTRALRNRRLRCKWELQHICMNSASDKIHIWIYSDLFSLDRREERCRADGNK